MPVSFVAVQFETAMRAGLVSMLEAFRTDVTGSWDRVFNIWPARPTSIQPPHAWVDLIREQVSLDGPRMRQRNGEADVVVVHGTFDSKDTVAQRDRFVDGFMDWLLDNPHAFGASTLAGDSVRIADEPDFTPSWLPPERQQSYFATRITVAGYVGG